MAHCFSLISTFTSLSLPLILFSSSLFLCVFCPFSLCLRFQLSLFSSPRANSVDRVLCCSFLRFSIFLASLLPPCLSSFLPSFRLVRDLRSFSHRCQFSDSSELNVRSCIWLLVWISDLSGCNRTESVLSLSPSLSFYLVQRTLFPGRINRNLLVAELRAVRRLYACRFSSFATFFIAVFQRRNFSREWELRPRLESEV